MDQEKFVQQNRRLFTRWARVYDHVLNRRLFFEPMYLQVQSLLLAAGAKHAVSVRVLDIACGTGEIIHRLAKQKPEWQFVGVDLTPAMIEQARQKNVALPNVAFHSIDATTLPFLAETFTLMLCTDAFHHFSKPEETLQELRRVAAPGAVLVLADAAGDGFLPRLLFNPLVRRLERAYHYYRQEEMRNLLLRYGFVLESVERRYLHNIFVSHLD